MSETYEQLVAAFKELMTRGEKDQWKLSEIAYLAINDEGIKPSKFAGDVGLGVDTVRKYRKTFMWRESQTSGLDYTFADAVVLANRGEVDGTAIQVLAGAMGKPIGSIKSDTEAINIVKDFLVENPELVKGALKDEAARSAVASAAFKAASEDVVAEASGITKEAAREKAPKKNTSMRAVQVEQLKYKAASVGRWAEGNLPALVREAEALAEYMTADELDFIFVQLGMAHDLISEARNIVNELRKAKV